MFLLLIGDEETIKNLHITPRRNKLVVEAFSGEVKVPVGLAGQGRTLGVGELIDLGEPSLGKQVEAMGEGRGCQVDEGCLLWFQIFLKEKKKAFIIFSYYPSDTCLLWKF